MAATIISPAIPTIEKILHPGGEISLTVTLILTITSLMMAIGSPIAGYLVDRVGRKMLLLWSLILYALAGSAGFYLETAEQILFSRMFLGLAVAGVMTSSTTLIADYLVGEEREKFLGYQMSFMAIGGFVFLITGGLLATWWWRAPFLVYLSSLILVIPVLLFISEPEITEKKVEEDGARIPCLTYIGIILTAMSGMMLYFLLPTRIPFFLEDLFDLPPSQSGFFMATSALAASLMASRYHWFHHYLTKPQIYALSFLVMGLGLVLIAHFEYIIYVYTAIAITGIGFGLLIPNSTVWVSQIAPPRYRGRLVGGLASALFFGQFLSTLFGEPIFRFNGLEGTFGVFGIGGFLSLVIGALYLINNTRRNHT